MLNWVSTFSPEKNFLALWSHRMLHSLMAEAFFSRVLTDSLSFLFRSQPWSPQAFSPLSQEEGGLLHLHSVQSGCCCFCCLFNGPDCRNCLPVVAVCVSQLILSCSLSLPFCILCLGVVEGHSDCSLFPTWPVLSGYNVCFIRVNLFYGSKSVHSSGAVILFAVMPL